VHAGARRRRPQIARSRTGSPGHTAAAAACYRKVRERVCAATCVSVGVCVAVWLCGCVAVWLCGWSCVWLLYLFMFACMHKWHGKALPVCVDELLPILLATLERPSFATSVCVYPQKYVQP
jgi:biotin transporter BioY